MEPLSMIALAKSLVSVAPSLVGFFKGEKAADKAQEVLDIAKQVTGKESPQDAVNAVLRDPEQARKFQENVLNYMIEVEREDTKKLQAVNQTMQAELASNDPYRGRWRPTFGYTMAICWFLLFFTICLAVIWTVSSNPAQLATVIDAMQKLVSATVPLFFIAMTVLGVAVHKRSQDKKVAAGHMVPGTIESLMGMLGRK